MFNFSTTEMTQNHYENESYRGIFTNIKNSMVIDDGRYAPTFQAYDQDLVSTQPDIANGSQLHIQRRSQRYGNIIGKQMKSV